MPLNRTLIGETWTAPAVYDVSREKIREYAVAIDDPAPAYTSTRAARDLGAADVVSPPAFATTLWFRWGNWPLTDPRLGKRSDPVCVMGQQSVQHHRPLVVGDRVGFRTTVVDIRDIGRHELLHLRHAITDESGAVVCELEDQMVSRDTAVTA